MSTPAAGIPDYLERYYWWAYVRPSAVRFFDRPWLINLILFGKYRTLRDEVLKELGPAIAGNTLQISCCYGELTPRLSERVERGGGTLDVVDVLPIQLENLKRKLSHGAHAALHRMDAAALGFPDASYDQVLVFFLLHEEPQEYREKTMREALRVLKPGGKIIIADYGAPSAWHPLRYLLLPFLGVLEPTAREMWRRELADILPAQMAGRAWRKRSYFGGLYQMLVSTGYATRECDTKKYFLVAKRNRNEFSIFAGIGRIISSFLSASPARPRSAFSPSPSSGGSPR